MDRYFYSIEKPWDTKEIHISGNVYFNDADETETDHRLAEWTGFCLTLSELEELKSGDIFDYLNERVDYLGDITEEDAAELCATYWGGTPGTELDIRDVTESTECGYYWCEV